MVDARYEQIAGNGGQVVGVLRERCGDLYLHSAASPGAGGYFAAHACSVTYTAIRLLAWSM